MADAVQWLEESDRLILIDEANVAGFSNEFGITFDLSTGKLLGTFETPYGIITVGESHIEGENGVIGYPPSLKKVIRSTLPQGGYLHFRHERTALDRYVLDPNRNILFRAKLDELPKTPLWPIEASFASSDQYTFAAARGIGKRAYQQDDVALHGYVDGTELQSIATLGDGHGNYGHLSSEAIEKFCEILIQSVRSFPELSPSERLVQATAEPIASAPQRTTSSNLQQIMRMKRGIPHSF